MHTDAVESVLGTKKAEAMGQFDLFGGADTATDAVFTIKVPEEEWEDKHKLALEREMLGLYVSGHPLNGVAHLLTTQVDTAIPADPRRRRPQRRPGARRRHPGRGEPPGEQERDALGLSAIGGPDRRHRGDVLPAHLLELRRGDHRRRGGAGQRQGQIQDDRICLIANDLVVPDFSNAAVDRPLAVSLPTRQCTVDKVTALKQVLARHPGTSQVHLRLISGERITTLELDQSLRVTPSSALMGDLKALLGPGCLG